MHLTRSTPCGDLTGQSLEIFWKISIFISIGDDLNPFVQHVFSKLLEFIYISSPHQHEVFQVRFMLDGLQKQGLESGVVHRPATTQEKK